MMGRIYLFLLLHLAGSLPAQTSGRPVPSGLGGSWAYSKRHTDAMSGMVNQAALAGFSQFRAACFAEKRFLLREWQHLQMAASMPLPSGQIGLHLFYSGTATYRETQAGLAFARNLGNRLDAGLQFNYHAINLGALYGNASAISFEAGTILHLSEKAHAGIHLKNPIGGKWNKSSAGKLPAVYRFGIGFDASAIFFAGIEMVKEEGQPVSIEAGLIYQPIPIIRIRAGMVSATATAGMSLGFQKKGWSLDLTASYHPRLGISPGMILAVTGSKRKNGNDHKSSLP